jgi:integrase
LNGYIESIVAFGYWLTGKRVVGKRSHQQGEKRLAENPFAGIGRFDIKSDRRRTRRALTEADLNRLLFVIRWRPLAEFGRETETKVGDDRPEDIKSRKTWTMKPLTMDTLPEAIERAKSKLADNPQFVDELHRRGKERSLIVKVAVLTGLRRNEIATLTIENFHLDESLPCIRMRSGDTKNRQADEIPLRVDLAIDLRQWIESLQEPQNGVLSLETKRKGLPLSTKVFNVPKQFVKTLDRDLLVAGIPKADDRGRTIDFHALRHTFGTLLSVGGVAPRTAQQAMRHSDIKLTMNTYTDPRLLDVARAVDALPMLRLSTEPTLPNREQQRATGTNGRVASGVENESRTVAPTVAPNVAPALHSESIPDNSDNLDDETENAKSTGKTLVFSMISQIGATGFEPATSTSRT